MSTIGTWLGRVVRTLLIVAILAGAGALSYYWLSHRPKAERRPPEKRATLVEVLPAVAQPEQIEVNAMGTVIPMREVQLASRVSGQVERVSPQFIPGGYLKKDELVLQVEQEDYALMVAQSEGSLVKARSDVQLEMGQQSVAIQEYQLLGEEAPEEDEVLLLRQPQLAAKEATVAIAQAVLDKARLDLARTSITAPFNAMVYDRQVELGAFVSPGKVVAFLVGTDEYWVEVSVPVDELQWIDIPGYNSETGSEVHVYHPPAWGEERYRVGRVLRLVTELEPQGRMARLLVSIPDPLHREVASEARLPMLLGAFVSVVIKGAFLEEAIRVPRALLHEGQYVWVMSEEKTLEIRPVTVAWSDEDTILVTDGIAPGERIVVSDLAAPVSGMALRLRKEAGTPAEQQPEADAS